MQVLPSTWTLLCCTTFERSPGVPAKDREAEKPHVLIWGGGGARGAVRLPESLTGCAKGRSGEVFLSQPGRDT